MSTFRKFLLSAILTFAVGIAYAQITNVKPPSTEYPEDAAHASGSKGTFVLGVRNDGGGVLAGTDGDYIPLTTDATGNLRITAIAEVATAADGGALPALTKVVSGYDGANVQVIKTDTGGELQIDVLTSALPAGAATEATLSSVKTAVETIDNAIAGTEMQVDVITSALPAGAATEASLVTIDAGVPAALGQGLMAASMPVTLASDQSALAVTGTFWQATQPVSGTFWQATQPVSAASLPLPTGAATEASLVTIDAGIPAALGQALMASSMPVTLASNQSALAVTGTFWQATQPVSGTFWQATQPVSGTFWQATQPVSGTFWQATQPVSAASLPLPTGAATEASLVTIDAGIPAALGQALMASSMPVTLASDQSALAVTGTFWQATQPVSGTFWQATQPVSAASLPLPTGAATEATLGSVKTAVEIIDNAIAGTEMQVDVVAALPTGTNSIGKVTVNADVTGSGSAASATVSTVIALTAPANAKGFILMNLDTSTANIRWAVGRTATTVLGQQLQAGRDTGFVPIGADVSLVAESGTQNYDIQWIAQ